MNAAFNFTHHRILVTGASSGIGREIALQLIASGAEVFALGRDAQALAAWPRLCLHASMLSFTHPQSGERLRFECPAPF